MDQLEGSASTSTHYVNLTILVRSIPRTMVEGKNQILKLSSYTESVLAVLDSAMENGTGMSALRVHTINRQTSNKY